MFCRVLEAKVQPGKMEQALAIFSQQMEKVKSTSGFLLAQAMQNEDDLLVVSSWRTEKDIRGYAASDLARDVLARLSTLSVEPPIVKSFAMKLAVEGEEGFFSHDEGGEG
jgi:heme-degrading monooxygenase HmoA